MKTNMLLLNLEAGISVRNRASIIHLRARERVRRNGGSLSLCPLLAGSLEPSTPLANDFSFPVDYFSAVVRTSSTRLTQPCRDPRNFMSRSTIGKNTFKTRSLHPYSSDSKVSSRTVIRIRVPLIRLLAKDRCRILERYSRGNSKIIELLQK